MTPDHGQIVTFSEIHRHWSLPMPADPVEPRPVKTWSRPCGCSFRDRDSEQVSWCTEHWTPSTKRAKAQGVEVEVERGPQGSAALSSPAASPSNPSKPRIVCLCGSTRFFKEFQVANYNETMAGRIVLSVGFYPHSDEHHETIGLTNAGYPLSKKAKLDELHLRKIDLADEVLVLNIGGYIGESTRREIAYAKVHGKPVRFLVEPSNPSTESGEVMPSGPGQSESDDVRATVTPEGRGSVNNAQGENADVGGRAADQDQPRNGGRREPAGMPYHEIRLDSGGKVDDVALRATGVHLARMSAKEWWLAVYEGDKRTVFWLSSRGDISCQLAENETDARIVDFGSPPEGA